MLAWRQIDSVRRDADKSVFRYVGSRETATNSRISWYRQRANDVAYWLQAAIQRIVIYVGLTASSGNPTR